MKDSRGERGVTLVELLVALVLSSILIFVLYKAFLGQHKTYRVQEQVFDLQQNARAMMARMVREIRMAGFGRVAGEYVPGGGYVSRILPVQFTNDDGTVVSYPNVLNRDQADPRHLTIITAVISDLRFAELIGTSSRFEITVDRVNYEANRAFFDEGNKRYISIDGVESNAITSITEETAGRTKVYRLTLQHPLEYNHQAKAHVYPIRAVGFDFEGREEFGGSNQPIVDEKTVTMELNFECFNKNGEAASTDRDIRMVRVAATATLVPEKADRDFRDKEVRPTRQMASNIQIRNLAFAP